MIYMFQTIGLEKGRKKRQKGIANCLLVKFPRICHTILPLRIHYGKLKNGLPRCLYPNPQNPECYRICEVFSGCYNKLYQLNSLKNKNVFSGSWKSKTKISTDSISGEGYLPGLQSAFFSYVITWHFLGTCMVEGGSRENMLSGVSFYHHRIKTLILSNQRLTLITSFNLTYLEAPSPI